MNGVVNAIVNKVVNTYIDDAWYQHVHTRCSVSVSVWEGFTVLSVALMTPAKDPTIPNFVTPVCTLALSHYSQMTYCDTRCRQWGGRIPTFFLSFFFSFLFSFLLRFLHFLHFCKKKLLFVCVWDVFVCTLGKDCVNFSSQLHVNWLFISSF